MRLYVITANSIAWYNPGYVYPSTVRVVDEIGLASFANPGMVEAEIFKYGSYRRIVNVV